MRGTRQRTKPYSPVDEYLLQAHVDEVGHQRAVVPSHRLDSLTVHLVVGLRASEVEPSVALLVDQQVREVDLRTRGEDTFYCVFCFEIGSSFQTSQQQNADLVLTQAN